jgi:hypothetical protein
MVLQPAKVGRQFVGNGVSLSMRRIHLIGASDASRPIWETLLHSSDAPMFEPTLEARRRIPHRVGRNQARERKAPRSPLYPTLRYAEGCGDLAGGHQPIFF